MKPLKVPDSACHEPGIAGSPRIDAWSPRTGSRGGFGPAAPHRCEPLLLKYARSGTSLAQHSCPWLMSSAAPSGQANAQLHTVPHIM